MELVDRDDLSKWESLLLNDPVGNYLPERKGMKVATAKGLEPARRQPTLQDMLRHTAGVSYGNRGDTPLHKLYESKLISAANQSGAVDALHSRSKVAMISRSSRVKRRGGMAPE